jgi:outer membrane protein
MKMALRIIMFGIILLAAGKGYCDTIPEKLNLSRNDAVSMALSKNIDLRYETLNSSMAEKDVAKSRGIYRPVFNASAIGGVSSIPGETFSAKSTTESIGLAQGLSTGGTVTATYLTGYTNIDSVVPGAPSKDWQSSAGILVSQPLLKNFGKETTELNITLAASALQDSLERLRFTTTDTVFSVIATYNRLYTLRQLLEAKAASLKSVQDLLDEIKKKEKPGSQQGMEVANAEFAIAQRQKELVDAERNVRDTEATLRYLIGMESKAQIIPSDPPLREEPQETEEQAVKAAMEFRPDLKQIRQALKTSQLQERVSRRQALPDLSVTGGGGINGFGNNFGNTYQQTAGWWSAGMQFSYPLGNTAAENEYLKSKFKTEQVQYQLQAFEWKIRNEVEADMRALISARLQLQTTDKALQSAEQRHEEYLKHQRAGTATVQDVINAGNDQIIARNAQLDAVEAFAYAVTKLWRDTGELLDHQGITSTPPNPKAESRQE